MELPPRVLPIVQDLVDAEGIPPDVGTNIARRVVACLAREIPLLCDEYLQSFRTEQPSSTTAKHESNGDTLASASNEVAPQETSLVQGDISPNQAKVSNEATQGPSSASDVVNNLRNNLLSGVDVNSMENILGFDGSIDWTFPTDSCTSFELDLAVESEFETQM